jgi:1-acylglycerone phosphate reductase
MPMLDSDISIVKAMFDTNVFSVLAVTQALAPQLIAAKGTIINIGSVGGGFALVYSSMYNASKAALRALSDTMRLELTPFDVKVMTVITGIVRTRIFQDLLNEQPSLPSGSLYAPIKDAVQVVIDGKKLLEGGVEPREFARGVVDNALRTNPELWFWKGGKATFVWFATSLANWLPRTWFDNMLAEDAGLNALKKHYQEKAKSV